MIIVLLLFFKSICLYCQRLVLHIHDRWINPKNVRLLKEAAEANGSKFQIEDYRRVKKSKKRRYAASSSASGQSSNTLADSDSCRFCANTPQGYCRHHFHLQELHVQKQQRQQKFWCPLSGVVGGPPNRSTEYRQLRKIKRELKRNIQQQQQQQQQHLKLTRTLTNLYEYNPPNKSNYPPSLSTSSNSHLSHSTNSSYLNNDSGYQTLATDASACLLNIDNSGGCQQLPAHSATPSATSVTSHLSDDDFVDIELPSPSGSLVETTYSFGTCYETPNHHSSPADPQKSPFASFVSCEYSTLSTTYL